MEFTAWEQSRRIEQNYLNAIKRLRRLLASVIEEGDSPEVIANKLLAIYQDPTFAKWAHATARTMVTHTLEENARTWREAARMAGKGRALYAAQQASIRGRLGSKTLELIDFNATFIKSVPQSVAKDLVRFTGTKAFADTRRAFLLPQFQELVGDMTMNHAKLIARTETAKAHAALQQAQAEDLGLDWYIWHSTKDIRTRDSHRHMDNVLCRYSDPPAPELLLGEKSLGHYNPGNIFNCRCYASEIILWRTVQWPHKVHIHGEIITLGKREFYDRFGGEIREL
jgi:SPP1 gp7 family putative phage head morphogenesis protein